MAFEFIAAIVAAIGLGGIAFLLRRLSKERLPKWSVPFAAAAGLLCFTLWSEYDWFSRISAGLPEGIVVVAAHEEAMPLRPWTYIVPLTSQFLAIDTRKIGVHPKVETLRMAALYRFARWRTPEQAMMIFDCAQGRQVLLSEGMQIDDAGQLLGGDWTKALPQDPMQTLGCAGA